MTSGFEHPDRGDLRIAGEDMAGVPPYRRPTNMVFQRWALFPHMTAAENVAFGLEVERLPRREIRERVGEALELVGLGEFAQRKPGQLSGGQMQRVALARALVKRPKVLLLDEPLGALDLKLRTQMQLELKRIQREVGTTFIYVTHDQGEAMTMSDRIAVMNKGRIEQIDTPAGDLRPARDPFRRGLHRQHQHRAGDDRSGRAAARRGCVAADSPSRWRARRRFGRSRPSGAALRAHPARRSAARNAGHARGRRCAT